MTSTTPKKPGALARTIEKIKEFANYCISGVWDDPRATVGVRIIKTINLSVNSFLDRGLQIKAMALTYSTVLALVPAIAMIVAIARGFGFQKSLMDELYVMFPSQHKAIDTALQFVDSYLTSATQGVFVGVGLIVLLWTVISLLSSIEDAFNSIWDAKRTRSFFQKITDYIAICLIIPILMICSSGVQIFMSTMVQNNIHLPFLTPVINSLLELTPLVLAWLAFSLSYALIPVVKVNFRYAMIAGALSAIGFEVLQLLFLNGQIYVSKYNAIYGSFAFLPLLLVWLQLSWLLLLSGCVLTYALQNVFTYNFLGTSGSISYQARLTVAVILMNAIGRRFLQHEPPMSQSEISSNYNLPVRLVGHIAEQLHTAGLIYYVMKADGVTGYAPAEEITNLSVARFIQEYQKIGQNNIIPDFNLIYAQLSELMSDTSAKAIEAYDNLMITDLPIPAPEKISEILATRYSASVSQKDAEKGQS